MSKYDWKELEDRRRDAASEMVELLRKALPALVYAKEQVLADEVEALLKRVFWPNQTKD